MTQIKVKRVYDAEERSDGFRVLADKLWPRGMKKEMFHYDLWAKNIAPSTPLRQWYHQAGESRWKEFEKKYTEELAESSAVKDFIDKIKDKQTVTLLYASKNVTENHALVLRDYLKRVVGKG